MGLRRSSALGVKVPSGGPGPVAPDGRLELPVPSRAPRRSGLPLRQPERRVAGRGPRGTSPGRGWREVARPVGTRS